MSIWNLKEEEKRRANIAMASADYAEKLCGAVKEMTQADRSRALVAAAMELINETISINSPMWKDCACGDIGCGKWYPETDAEKKVVGLLWAVKEALWDMPAALQQLEEEE